MHRKALLIIVIFLFTVTGNAQLPNQKSISGYQGSFEVGAVFGPSLLVEKAPDSLVPQIQDYFNKLRSGWHYGFETEYFFNKYMGIGAKYCRFNSKQEADSIVIQFFSKIYYVDLSNNMSIHTVAPMVYGRLPLLDDKLTITAGIGPGWLFYRNIGKAVGDSAMFKGSSPGLSTSLLVGYEVIKNLSIGIQCSYIHAYLKEFTQDSGTTQEVIELEAKDYQNISRLDFSFGIIYSFRRK